MALILFTVFLVSFQNNYIVANYVSDTIKEDVDFLKIKISNYPSKFAIIEYIVSYTITDTVGHHVKMDIYTIEDNVNSRERCSALHYGQLQNDGLHVPLNTRTFRETDCERYDEFVSCQGQRIIQDYIPRDYFVSFGFDCDETGSMKGLAYEIRIHGQTNETKCIDMPPKFYCSQYYRRTSVPNLIGGDSLQEAMTQVEIAQVYMYMLYLYMLENGLDHERCYKYFDELMCYISVPKCDVNEENVIVTCKETCFEILEACHDDLLAMVNKSTSLQMEMKDFKDTLEKMYMHNDKYINCSYLPPTNGTVPCFYRLVTCEPPPNVTDAVVQDTINITFPVDLQVQYSCIGGTEMFGNKTITCLYSGQWSKPPECVKPKSSGNFSKASLLLLFVPVLIILLTVFILNHRRRRRKKIPKLTRQKKYDAFVCYSYDTADSEFAETTLRMQLEENQDPQFQLCIHRRDFKAAWDIMWNIRNAIDNCNSAIIVLSQDYVNSLWCKEEFEQCYVENMKDQAFKLFVIMMQPANSLTGISEYMKSFFAQKTYLERNDPKLFKKIAEYLTWVKKFKSPKKKRWSRNGTKDETADNQETLI